QPSQMKRDGHYNRASPGMCRPSQIVAQFRGTLTGLEAMESGTAEIATILPRLPQSLAVQLFAGATPHHLKPGEATRGPWCGFDRGRACSHRRTAAIGLGIRHS